MRAPLGVEAGVGEQQPLDGAAVEEIVTRHLVQGHPVERLRIAESCLNTESCPHRKGK